MIFHAFITFNMISIVNFGTNLKRSAAKSPWNIPTRVLNGTTNGISRNIVIDRTCFVDNGGPLLSKYFGI